MLRLGDRSSVRLSSGCSIVVLRTDLDDDEEEEAMRDADGFLAVKSRPGESKLSTPSARAIASADGGGV